MRSSTRGDPGDAIVRALITADQLRRSVPGGIGTYVRGLAQGLQRTPNMYVGLWASKAMMVRDPLNALGDKVVSVPMPAKLLTRAWDHARVQPPSGWDVVHATSFAVPPKADTPMTAMVHDLGWQSFPDAYPERGRRWHEAALTRTIERASILFTPSRATANALIDFGVASSRVAVIPLGCDHLAEPDKEGTQELLRGRGVADEFILAVGTLEPRKNLARLIAAYEKVRVDLPAPWPLVIVGPSGWGKAVKPSAGVVIIKTARPEQISALYESCKMFVSVPILEGFGLPVLEAMSKGAPVVSSSVPSAGDATYLVDPNNTAAIGEAMLHVSRDVDLRGDLTRRGYAHSRTLTWANCAELHVAKWATL